MDSINLTNADDAIFHTVQGEGKYVGYPCTFVRLTRCNLRCAWKNKDGSITTCDTPHTSFNPIVEKHLISDVVKKVTLFGAKHVVVSGGEPYFQKSVVTLINSLVDAGHYVTVETNGTMYRDTKAQFISISPKLSTSSASLEKGKMHEKNRLNYENLTELMSNHDYQLKFVVNTLDDVTEIKGMIEELTRRGLDSVNDKVWVMPQGITDEQFMSKMPWMVEVCKEQNWKLTDRLHIRIFGSRKGV